MTLAGLVTSHRGDADALAAMSIRRGGWSGLSLDGDPHVADRLVVGSGLEDRAGGEVADEDYSVDGVAVLSCGPSWRDPLVDGVRVVDQGADAETERPAEGKGAATLKGVGRSAIAGRGSQ